MCVSPRKTLPRAGVDTGLENTVDISGHEETGNASGNTPQENE